MIFLSFTHCTYDHIVDSALHITRLYYT